MVYKYVNGSVVVHDIFDQYNIKSEEFIQRTPNWILRCLEEIQSYYVYVDKFFKGRLDNGRIYLPEELKKIRNVWIDGVEALPVSGYRAKDKTDCRVDTVYKFTDVVCNNSPVCGQERGATMLQPQQGQCQYVQPIDNSDTVRYVYNPYGGWDLQSWLNPMTANCNPPGNNLPIGDDNDDTPRYLFENGWLRADGNEVVVLYASLPMEYDENNQMWFPLIPDNEDVRTAIGWYILMRLLYRGYIHPVLSLKENNQFTNPGLAYKFYARKARMSCASMNLPYRKTISKEMRIKFGTGGD